MLPKWQFYLSGRICDRKEACLQEVPHDSEISHVGKNLWMFLMVPCLYCHLLRLLHPPSGSRLKGWDANRDLFGAWMILHCFCYLLFLNFKHLSMTQYEHREDGFFPNLRSNKDNKDSTDLPRHLSPQRLHQDRLELNL